MLQAPRLDDRRFQDIVDEAKKRIPFYCKEWTDHNVSDPGVTLIELFAWMTEMTLYRMNRIPELHQIKLMELLGIRLKGPHAAEAPITFWLSEPRPQTETILAYTEVSTTQTENKRPVIFTTKNDFKILVPALFAVYTQDNGQHLQKQPSLLPAVRGVESGVKVFSDKPHEGDALYFGFENDLSHHLIHISMEVQEGEAQSLNPNQPPWQWEVYNDAAKGKWEFCEIDDTPNANTIGGFNRNGHIQIHLPTMSKAPLGAISQINPQNTQPLFWLRVKVIKPTEEQKAAGMNQYGSSPIVKRIVRITSVGCTIQSVHAVSVRKEIFGQSDGSPGQRFHLSMSPLLARQTGEHIQVQPVDEAVEDWQEVSTFAGSGPTDHHYMLDSTTGEVRFGPAVRLRNGEIKRFGAVPTRNATLSFTRYRYGGGLEGNVQQGELNTLKSSIPYIKRVMNRAPAAGGMEAQQLEEAMVEAPKRLYTAERAVVAQDFEHLTMERFGHLFQRVKCLGMAKTTVKPTIDLRVVPRVEHPENPLTKSTLALNGQWIEQLSQYLGKRRLLGTLLRIQEPSYYRIEVNVQISTTEHADQKQLEETILRRLYRFLNPLIGGPKYEGWPFGYKIDKGEIQQVLLTDSKYLPESAEQIQTDWIRKLTLSVRVFESGENTAEANTETDSTTARGQEQPSQPGQWRSVDERELSQDGLVVSGTHNVEFV